MTKKLKLVPLTEHEREQFILDNQRAFKYGATEEFGMRDEHYEEDGEIISRKTIEESIDAGIAFRIVLEDQNVGGLVLRLAKTKGELDLLFVLPEFHNRGIGYAAWCLIEAMFPQIRLWETYTPYFETRNIHFYVNRCGFHIVEYFNTKHPGKGEGTSVGENLDGMFRFEKSICEKRLYCMEEKICQAY